MHHRPPTPGGSVTRRVGTPCPPETLALSLRADALAEGHVVLVGNRAGVVEWTTDAWTQLTGFPLEHLLGKPIKHFLDHAGLEVALVDFVAQHFLDGRRITVELPFATCDGREIHVHLEVEPIREPILPPVRGDAAVTEITRFIAVARQIETPPTETPAHKDQPASTTPANNDLTKQTHPKLRYDDPHQRPSTNSSPSSDEGKDQDGGSYEATRAAAVDIAQTLSAAVERKLRSRPGDRMVETLCAGDLPKIQVDSDQLTACLDQALEAATEPNPFGTTFVTTDCGWLEPGRSHRSLMHPIAARAIPPSGERRLYIEIHDTLPHLDREAIARIHEGRPGPAARERAISSAAELATGLGFSFHLDSTAGCGTQQLLVRGQKNVPA